MISKLAKLILLASLILWIIYFTNVTYIMPHYAFNHAIERQRRLVKSELYAFGIENYTIGDAKKARYIHNILLSTWSAGQLSILRLFKCSPGLYHHYDPLLQFGMRRLRSPAQADMVLDDLRNLLHCNYTRSAKMLETGRRNQGFMRFYGKQRNLCMKQPAMCWSTEFLANICRLYPFQAMSLYHLPLERIKPLMTDTSLNVRIILLVRDPRGTMQSRRHRVWCGGNPDCDDPKLVCEDLVADYKSAENLLKLYPSRFRTLRYEDLSLNAYEVTQDVLQFYGLPFDPMVEEFLDTHTKVNIGGVSSTYRDSRSAPFHWKQDLKIEEIKYIQDQCTEAMDLWGYRKIDNFTDFQRTFDPIILPPPFT